MKLVANLILLTTVTLISCKIRYKKNHKIKTKAIQTLIYDDIPEYPDYPSISEETKFLNRTFDLTGDLRKRFAFMCAGPDIKQSVICSPTSALLPLGKLALGAQGETEKQILQAIGINTTYEINEHFTGVIQKLMVLQGVVLHVASQLYVTRNKRLKNTFQELVTHIFPSGVAVVDMSNSRGVADTINKWISKQTNYKIKKVIEPHDISSKADVIIVNAIYFTGKWKIPFDEVKSGTFYRHYNAVSLPMMSVEDYYMYTDSRALEAQVIKIPYEKEEVSFYIYLPRRRNGLTDLLKKLEKNPELLNSDPLRRRKVELKIPKFKIEAELNLKFLYRKVGLTEILETGSGLNKMFESESVYVNEAIQKAIIEVTEEGTTAAASSVLKITPLSYVAPEYFVANHPFLFFIVANKEQLFSGVFIGDGKDAKPIPKLLNVLRELINNLRNYLEYVFYANDFQTDYDLLKKKKRTHQIPLANREARNSQEFDVHGNFRKEFGLSCAMADPKRSVICSPISALLPLGKLVLGADGKSEKELLKTIGLSSASEVEKHFKKLISTLGALHGVRLDIASQIYMNKDSKLHSNYKKKVKSIFGSTIQTVDMDDADGVSSKINSWVSHQTHQKINDLLKPGDIVPGTMTILVNAIYFSGKWKHPFKIVRDDIFYGAKGNITIPMMTIEEHYHYGVSKALNSEIIKIPYSKEEAFFYICLPEKEGGVELLLEQLKLVPDLLNSAQLVKQKVKLTMPKFKIETEFDLGRLYQDLGLKSMFESYHGLKNMVKGKSIVVNKAIHKAMIEVTEEGTIAAAASVITGLGAAMYVPEIIKFKANRPFLYFIVAQKQQLFAGLFTGN